MVSQRVLSALGKVLGASGLNLNEVLQKATGVHDANVAAAQTQVRKAQVDIDEASKQYAAAVLVAEKIRRESTQGAENAKAAAQEELAKMANLASAIKTLGGKTKTTTA